MSHRATHIGLKTIHASPTNSTHQLGSHIKLSGLTARVCRDRPAWGSGPHAILPMNIFWGPVSASQVRKGIVVLERQAGAVAAALRSGHRGKPGRLRPSRLVQNPPP